MFGETKSRSSVWNNQTIHWFSTINVRNEWYMMTCPKQTKTNGHAQKVRSMIMQWSCPTVQMDRQQHPKRNWMIFKLLLYHRIVYIRTYISSIYYNAHNYARFLTIKILWHTTARYSTNVIISFSPKVVIHQRAWQVCLFME